MLTYVGARCLFRRWRMRLSPVADPSLSLSLLHTHTLSLVRTAASGARARALSLARCLRGIPLSLTYADGFSLLRSLGGIPQSLSLCLSTWTYDTYAISLSLFNIPRTRQHTSYVSIRQHTSAYVSIRQHTGVVEPCLIVDAAARTRMRQYTSAYASIRQHWWETLPDRRRGSARPHTSAYVRIRQDTSAYVSIGGRIA
jgi:hypothetical protein